MRAVLIGADLMYRQDGKLVPIEINTNTAWDVENRVEEFDDCFDFDSFNAFLELHNIEEVWVDGLLSQYLVEYFGSRGINIVKKTSQELEEAEDRDNLLLLRTSYSDEALVDAFCRDKDLFLEAIKNLEFGCEFILKTAEGFVGSITEFADNGNYPNFVVKYRYPHYSRSVYPKLVKLSNSEELEAFLNSEEMEEDYLIMPFYYNEDQLWEQEGEKRMKLLRHLSMFALINGSLEAIPVVTYTKLCGNLKGIQCQYSELGVLDSKSRKAFLSYWTERSRGDVLAEQGDLVLMADDTWKLVEDLAIGDEIKALDIPAKGGADIKNHIEDYNISFDELIQSSSFSSNRVTGIGRRTGLVSKVNFKFTDGTDWWDTAESSYPTIDPEDGTIWFRTLDMLKVGDKLILLKANSLENPVFEEKEIAEINRERQVVTGYSLTVDGSHLFLTRTQEDEDAYVSIEHNDDWVDCYAVGEGGAGSSYNNPCLSYLKQNSGYTMYTYDVLISTSDNDGGWSEVYIQDYAGIVTYSWSGDVYKNSGKQFYYRGNDTLTGLGKFAIAVQLDSAKSFGIKWQQNTNTSVTRFCTYPSNEQGSFVAQSVAGYHPVAVEFYPGDIQYRQGNC